MQSQQSNSKTWDLSLLFNDINDPKILQTRKEVEEKYNSFISKWKDRVDYTNDPHILSEALKDYEELNTKYSSYGDEVYYFYLLFSTNENDAEIKARYNTIYSLSKKLDNDIQFFSYAISKIPKEKQTTFLKSPELKEYKHYLEGLFESAKYLLGEEAEKVLNLKSKTSYLNWLQMTSSFLSKESREITDENGKKSSRTFEEIVGLMNSSNKSVRDDAAKAFNEILAKYIEVGEVELNSIIENKQIDDSLRNVKRPDEIRHLSDDIETSVVDTLSNAVSKRYDIAQSYYQLKAQLLHVSKLKYHERNIEYGSTQKKYSYEESVKLVNKVFLHLDKEFSEIFTTFVNNRHIDVYPKEGKRGGAFCAHNLITQPTYILLNHTDQLNDVLTLAHESGHGINNELIKQKQNALNFGTSTATAEVASTFMEDFVLQELMKEADDEMKLSLLMTKLNSDISTIFRQIAAYKFELELHDEFRKTGYLSKEKIGELFQKHMSAYMGDSVENSKGSENWWLYWTHIRYFFYNYSYASGLLISKSLQASVKKDHDFILKVKEFLSAGRSESPKQIFKKLGIDISDEVFWRNGISEVEQLLNQTKELARKLKKID
jgi:oligoendopeptidase F